MIIEYAPFTSSEGDETPGAQQLTFDTSGFVQMELQGLEDAGAATDDSPEPARRNPEADAEA